MANGAARAAHGRELPRRDALALADATDADVATRARVAAEGAEERVRVVLTGALDGALDDVALDAVIAEEKKARRRG